MKKAFFVLSAILLSVTLTACVTIKEIPEDKTSAQIIQLGQNYISLGSYDDAVFCFETAIERFGTDPSVYVEAKYELGHTYSKQKKYDKAYAVYTELLDLYDSSVTGSFPASYKKLCQIGINSIPENKLKSLQAKN